MLLVPIGHNLGAFHLGDGAHVQQVRRGADIVELSDVDFAVWALAHGSPTGADTGAWDRRAVTAVAAELGLTGVDPVIDGFLDTGLLAEVDPQDAVGFAERHRLVPLLLGLGTADEPGLHQVGLLGTPLLTMTAELADLWEWSPLSADLWQACHESAALTDTAPDEVLTAVIGALHSLLSMNAACLDVRVGTP
ncbi:hypothetical protein [Alloactinosynnema sp. L-07]|uniref:hypothetical protein n=1 Tax=Alloactinosynnema sp. L-07 TaxID=1653480 RepID=UPI00065F0AC5|nr:hypothetical protein [Alloactinosynnema sp. L-07]CRK58769.1 hypothetical protein [Alloactinosynnema sp. L-07]